MRFRFTISDLLWLTLMVALCAAWWIDRWHLVASHDRYRQHLQSLDGTTLLNPEKATSEGWSD